MKLYKGAMLRQVKTFWEFSGSILSQLRPIATMQPGPPGFPYFVLYISGNDTATDFREPSPMIQLTMKATVNLSYYTQTTSVKRIELPRDQQSY